jgi:hypothetical protein
MNESAETCQVLQFYTEIPTVNGSPLLSLSEYGLHFLVLVPK